MKLHTLKAKLKKTESVPEGWKTAAQWSEYWKIGPAQTARMISEAVGAKLCLTKRFRRMCPGGALRCIPHYKFREVV